MTKVGDSEFPKTGKDTETKQKKPRRPAVRDASFFLYKKVVVEGEENGDLSPIGSFETETGICENYEKALDNGIPEKQLTGFKGRPLEFKVQERRITVR